MTRAALLPLLLALAFLAGGDVGAAGEEEVRQITLGYVELADDPRYRHDSAYAGIAIRTLGRPFAGAEVGLGDARATGRFAGIGFDLVRTREGSVAELAERVRRWVRETGVRFVLADLPAEVLVALADALADVPVLIFNLSAPDDRLRGADCRANVVHVHPSEAMLADALAQYLAAKGWRDVLMLVGPSEADARRAAAMRAGLRKFGLEVADERGFVLSNDPRQRDRNNVALATGGVEHDVVLVVDTDGEFDRYVPYQTMRPRPVVGTEGLEPQAWHWSWHRHGAPQLQHRFEAQASPRRMNGPAWAAWASVKAVVQAALRADGPSFEAMRSFILGDALNLDGGKGTPMSVRPWDQQVRQPILLARENAVIARAPLPEFLHRQNVLDTLGTDAAESACRIGEAG